MNNSSGISGAKYIAILLPSLVGCGAERSMLHLVRSFIEQGRSVDLLLCRAKGALLDTAPKTARLVTLKPTSGTADGRTGGPIRHLVTAGSGSAEILEHGRYGRLVPVKDQTALVDAIDSILDEITNKDELRKRASLFSVEFASQQYLDYLDNVVERSTA